MLQNIFFYHKWIAGGNGTHGTHYYITRGRVGARKREKDAEERNNRNYSRITAKKKKATRKKILEKRLKENGELIYANYVETVLNTSYRVNGKCPYNIICEWNNPLDGKKYVFKSKNIWTDPESTIEERNIKQFPVYINRDNMKKYAIDIEVLTENMLEKMI